MIQNADIVDFFDGKQDSTLNIENNDCKSYISKKLNHSFFVQQLNRPLQRFICKCNFVLK